MEETIAESQKPLNLGYKKTLLNTTQLAGWMKTGSPKANKHGISWA